MPDVEDFVVSGAKLTLPKESCSVGEYLYPLFKSAPEDEVLQVDGITGESVTAGQLLKVSVQVAEGLKQLGIKQEDVVCFCVRNGHQTFHSAIGALWLSAVLAPIDPALKVYEMKYLFNIIQPRVVICDENVVDTVITSLKENQQKPDIIVLGDNPDVSSPLIKFKDLLKEVDVETFKPSTITDPKEQLCSILCSSGTTGFPKGVGLSHYNIWYQLQLFVAGVYPKSFLQVTQFFWGTGLLILILSLKLHIKRTFVKIFDPVQVLKTIDQHKPNWLLLSPAELLTMVRHPDFHKYDVSSIKFIQAIGAPMSDVLKQAMKSEWKSEVITVSSYGMTEMTGMIAVAHPRKPNSVGQLAPGAMMKVVDIKTGKPLGPNQNGEFLFKSPGVMKGYVRNDEATKETVDEDGWLHTGDLGYYDEEHFLYIVDKIKEFIKYRTWQIPPAELESLIGLLPGVREVAVAGVPHEADIFHPMALVIKEPGSKITEDEIMKHVEEKVADYKQLRAGVRFVENLPRTPTGKIKRMEIKELAKKLYKL